MKTLRDSQKQQARLEAKRDAKADRSRATRQEVHNARMIQEAATCRYVGLLMRNGWLEKYDSRA